MAHKRQLILEDIESSKTLVFQSPTHRKIVILSGAPHRLFDCAPPSPMARAQSCVGAPLRMTIL